ncbi:tetratricopeptide repeat protein [bacterium]|nr:tetratricopeptide repeat protein [candidate division CSSED10-310 bacterium]
MSPKKRLSKKELREDELKVAFLSAVTYYKENQKRINYILMAVVGALVVGILLRISITSMNRNAADTLDMGLRAFDDARVAAMNTTAGEEQEKNPNDSMVEALESFEMVVNNYPRSSSYRFGLIMAGNASYELGEYDKAIEFLSRFLDKYTHSPLADQASSSLAYAYEQKGDLQKALEIFTAMLRARDGVDNAGYYSKSELYLDIARVNEQLGKKDDALEYYQKHRDEFPESQHQVFVKDKVAELS